MKLVLDMNLTPDWVPLLAQAGHTAVHWSTIGSPRAKDREILTKIKGSTELEIVRYAA